LELDQSSHVAKGRPSLSFDCCGDACRAETDAVAAWQKQIFIRLNASRSFPPQAMGQSGTAKVRFVLDRSGKLISNQILQSSGLKPFDLEAVAIVD
jgi:periplasmic protein TonB